MMNAKQPAVKKKKKKEEKKEKKEKNEKRRIMKQVKSFSHNSVHLLMRSSAPRALTGT